MRDGFKRFVTAFFALLFVAAGTALLHLQLQHQAKAKASATWPETNGMILETDFKRTSAGRRSSNAPDVTYSYVVNQRSYTQTSRIGSFGKNLTDSEAFEQYPSGRSVPVYYNPEDPQDSVLEKGFGPESIARLRYVQIIFGLSLAFLAYVTTTEVKKFRYAQ